jgi:hypothetical protein
MKTCVLLPFWLLLTLTLQAQVTPCRACCNAPDEPGLLLILAPELADQCPACTLVAVAQCPITTADIAAHRSVLRYTLRDPAGVTSTHFAPMIMTTAGWRLQLYPPGDPAPACQPDAL